MQNIKTQKLYKAKVVQTQKVSEFSFFLEFDCFTPVYANPGQFITIYCPGLTFRRPFSIYSLNDSKIGILVKERGKGTNYLKSLKIGDNIDVSGTFGNGFTIKNKKSLLVGAGIGIAPIAYLQRELNKQNIENLFIAGFSSKADVINSINTDKIYTLDGSIGDKGSVLDYLENVINDYKPVIIYSCAPYIVLKNVSKTAKSYNIEVQTAMENVMACAIGVCRGCVIEIIKNGEIQNASVCKDGPVFNGSEVVWR